MSRPISWRTVILATVAAASAVAAAIVVSSSSRVSVAPKALTAEPPGHNGGVRSASDIKASAEGAPDASAAAAIAETPEHRPNADGACDVGKPASVAEALALLRSWPNRQSQSNELGERQCATELLASAAFLTESANTLDDGEVHAAVEAFLPLLDDNRRLRRTVGSASDLADKFLATVSYVSPLQFRVQYIREEPTLISGSGLPDSTTRIAFPLRPPPGPPSWGEWWRWAEHRTRKEWRQRVLSDARDIAREAKWDPRDRLKALGTWFQLDPPAAAKYDSTSICNSPRADESGVCEKIQAYRGGQRDPSHPVDAKSARALSKKVTAAFRQ
jgi:hypothetical protein